MILLGISKATIISKGKKESNFKFFLKSKKNQFLEKNPLRRYQTISDTIFGN
jgi:hypothetical protein